jgi:hypothetical protein
MIPDDRAGWRGTVLAFVHSYAMDLRGWATGLTIRYAVAVAMVIGGILAVFAAAAVGITALFHFIEDQYGIDAAYAGVGGGLFLAGILLFLLAWTLLRGRTPALPRPQRQTQSVKRMMIGPAAVRAVAGLRQVEGARADPLTEVLAAVAATVLVGWVVASRLGKKSQTRQVRQ